MRFHQANSTAYLNFLHAQFERRAGKVAVSSRPYIMGIESSSHCQLRCPMCPTGIENEARRSGEPVRYRSRAHLDEAVFDTLLSELGEFLFLIMFYNWGEPLLNKNLPSLIRRARSQKIATEIHTNLSLQLSDERIEDLLTSGIDNIEASLDGFSQESYATYRRGGDFELVKSNIVRLAKARDRLGLDTTIIWNFLVFSWNEHEIALTKSFCEPRGIIFNQREAFVQDPDWLPSYRRQEAEHAPSPEPVSAPLATETMEAEGTPTPPAQASCGWHYGYTMVNSNGSISPCCAPWEDRHDFGRVEPGAATFADIWNNGRYLKARGVFSGKKGTSLPKVETLCDQCPYDRSIQNLYSPLDKIVVEQFHRLRGSDWTLKRAFSLLNDPKKFVDFCQHHFDDGEWSEFAGAREARSGAS